MKPNLSQQRRKLQFVQSNPLIAANDSSARAVLSWTAIARKMFFSLFFLCLAALSQHVVAQTQLITTSNGGFENATSTFAANGWSQAQPGNTRQWQVGTAAGSVAGGTKAAYVGNSGSYNGANNASVQHFYRDVAIPALAANVQFRFYLRMPTTDNGDNFWVFRTTTANTPVSGTVPGAGYTQLFYNTSTAYASFTAMSAVDLTALAGTTVRLVFTFQSDGSNPAANPAVDNVTLSYTPAPVISGFASPSGCASTGSITINGTDLNSASAVTIGGTAVSSITSNTATQIVAVIGTGTTGTVSVTTPGGTANSAGTFTVNPLPTVYNVTGGGTYCSTGTGLSIGLSNSDIGIDYQLLRGVTPVGSPVAGTGSSISFGLQTLAGTYTVRATNATTSCVRNQSGSAIIAINTAPSISVQPVSIGRCVGAAANFSVTAAGTSVSYQWRKNGVDISGQTASTFSIPAVVAGDAGNYDVVVNVPTCTPLVSSTAVLTVNALPTIYNVTGGGSGCTSVNVGLSGSQVGVNYTLSPGGIIVAGTGSAISFGGQTTPATYTVAAANATTGCINNMSGSAVVTILSAPTITTQPTDQSVCSGSPISFTVAATGGSLTYQWRRGSTNLVNGGTISGATSATLTISSAVVGDAATDYNCEVNNSCDNPVSDYVTLTVNTAAIAPTAQPASLAFPTIGVTSVIGTFSASTSATHYLVVRSSTILPPTNPSNGTTYTVGSTSLGLGTYVEYSGTDSSFTSNGLNQGTTYYYWIYAYNTSPCGSSPMYYTSSPLSGSATTATNISCVLTPTLYWAGTGSFFVNGAATDNFNTASNWSTLPALYLPSLAAPTGCTNVSIIIRNNVTMKLSANLSVYNMNFTAENGCTAYLSAEGFTLTINGNANVDIASGNNSWVGIGENSSSGGIVDFKGNVTIGTNAATSGSGKRSFFLGRSSSKLIFRADLLLGRTCVISSSRRPGTVEFDGVGLQQVLWNNDLYFANFYDVVVGNVNNPIVRHVTGTYTPDNILNSLTINGSSTLDLAGSQWIRDDAGGSFTMNGTSSMILGNDHSIPSPANGRGIVIPGSNFPGGFNTVTIASGTTIEYDGDNAMTQTVYDLPTYGNLTLTNSTGSGTASKITTAAVTISGTSNVKNGVTFTPGAGITSNGTFNVNSGATLVCANNVISGSGSFVLKSGGTINIGSTQGISASGATGNITTTTRNYSTGANYIYNSSGASVTGNGLPTLVNDLTINNASGVTLFAGSTNYTVGGTLRLTAGSFLINGNTLTINSLIRTSGSLRGSASSSLTVNGTGTPLFFTAGGRIIKNFTMGTNATASLLTDMEIPGGVNAGTVTIGSGATLTTNSRLILRSTATGTARVAEIPVDGSGNALGFISGNVQVERFLSARRAWRFLSVVTSGSQTINAAWQEGQAANVTNPAGYGIQITGPYYPNGFDLYTITPSMKTYVPLTDTWASISGTNIPFTAGTAYMTFVRGDRTVNAFGQAATSTILRNRGPIITGNQSAVTVGANKFAAINNPFASDINFKNVLKSNVDDKFYVWDPYLGTLGAYQTFIKNGSGDYEIVLGGGSYGSAGTVYNDIPNGQAFMVFATGTSGTLTLQENDKSVGVSMVSRENINAATNPVKQLRTRLFGTNAEGTNLVDGVLNQFDNEYNNEVDSKDALKGFSFGENLSLKTANKLLVVDRRKEVVSTDTIYFNLSSTKAQQYKFQFIPSNLGTDGLTAFFQDSYLQTSTPLSLNDSSEYSFTIVNIPGSYAQNRFRIVFNRPAPASITQVSAARNNGVPVAVNWQVQHENNVQQYELEHSTNGANFSRIAFVDPNGTTNASTSAYQYVDQAATTGANFYRVKVISTCGGPFYSDTVDVRPLKSAAIGRDQNSTSLAATAPVDEPQVSVFPNPVSNKQMNVRFVNMNAGDYKIELTNLSGQSVYSTRVSVNSKAATKMVALSKTLAAGNYQLKITSADGQQVTQQVVIQ